MFIISVMRKPVTKAININWQELNDVQQTGKCVDGRMMKNGGRTQYTLVQTNIP